jgi:hypothetical protein
VSRRSFNTFTMVVMKNRAASAINMYLAAKNHSAHLS